MYWRIATYLEQLNQIMKLAMNVTADCNRGINLQHILLSDQDLLCLRCIR